MEATYRAIDFLQSLGWAWDAEAEEWRLNDTGEGAEAVAKDMQAALQIVAANWIA